MSESSTPTGGKQEKTMSSRLLTMKVHILSLAFSHSLLILSFQFMQRAAASVSKSTILNPINSPHDPNGHPAKRQMLSPPGIQTPDLDVSSPRSLYGSDDLNSPRTGDRSTKFRPQIYGGNTAETPWVLNLPRNVDMIHQTISMQETTSSQEDVVGRRTFGNFKKKTTEKVIATEDGDEGDSLGSGDLDGDFEQHSSRMYGKISQNGVEFISKRKKSPDNDRMDSIRLKKLKNGGISAASGMRQPGFDRRKYTKDKRIS
jgi:hypothetical protein